MKTSKRLLSLLLALTMVLSLMGNLSVAAFAEEVTPTVVTTDGNDQPTAPVTPDGNEQPPTPVTPDEGQTTPANADKSGGETPAPANGNANAEPVPAEGEVTTPAVAVPKLKDGVSPTASARVMTGTPYLLSDLQAGKIFDGEGLTYENYYYERSADNGQSWGTRQKFETALFGGTLIQLTETVAGTYIYRFYASFDGENFSADTWTLTLTVEDNPTMEFSFFVGKDYTGGYPVIKLYNVTKDADGNEVLGGELENVFLYSNFTDTLPEGEEEYDPAMGKLDSTKYQMFYAKLTAGRYAYRAFAKDADGNYTVALGGMTLNLPTDKNVDGGAGGGNKIYLQCNSFYTNSKKADNTYFTAEEYHVRVTCPIMKCDAAMGDPYIKDNYTYYPTMLYAAGNACLYNLYAYPDIEGYIFTQTINQTYRASYSAGSKNLTINTGVTLDVTVPANATFGLYFQWNNFNTTEVEPETEWTTSADGKTKTAQYFISKSNSNYTWRLSDATHVTQAGWLASQSESGKLTFSFAENAATDRVSHDFSNLGTQTINRDEADLQVNLDPSGYEAITGTTRVRAYRHWQLINSDAGNIMVEPDFHWNTLTGDAAISPVNGGNTTANWADITAGTQDSIIAVYYDSVDVNPSNHGSHGGLFPATSPERVGVIVVGGTGVTHGTADAKVKYNMASGVTTTRSEDWDYNYDTWFYEASEANPALDFTVNATGSVTVEYALVATDNSMNTTVSGFQTVSPDADGNYAVPLVGFNAIGNSKGGTVILKMTDSTGVSYRLVRVAKVTITAENVSNPGEDIMPGDQVKLSFKGMYRAVNKISGIFNPTNFKPTYFAGDAKYEGTLGQYQKMDNATVTVTIPEDLAFEDGKETTQVTLTNGYTYGFMYSAANPFAFLYGMTDTGVGTNMNAVTVNYYMNHYADAVITVARKVNYDVNLNITDDNGSAVSDVTVTLTDSKGNVITPNENGTYTLGYGVYTYTLSKNGYVVTRSSFSLGSADAADVKDGVLDVKTAVLPKAGENAWDGKTKTEPKKDDNGVYLIGTAEELAWFAQAVNNGQRTINAKLTADIELAGYDWTPIGNVSSSSKGYKGTFDGDGHWVKNLYMNSSSYPVGLFGYLNTGAVVMGLAVTGDVTCTASSNARAGGVAGHMEDNTTIANCYSAVNVNSKKHGGSIAGYTAGGSIITNCYASGNITTTSKNECYLGGICGSFYKNTDGATLTNCYSIGDVTGTSGAASYLGGLTPSNNAANYVGNCFYLDGTVSKESSKYGIIGKGTALSESDMLKKLGVSSGKGDLTTALEAKWKTQLTADQKAAASVIKLIDAIGDVTLTDACKAKIDAARAAYDKLTPAQQLLVDNYKTLTAAEKTLKKLEEDKAAAKAVDDLIDAIGKVQPTDDSKAKIDAARAAYDALTDAQKAMVEKLDALTAAEKKYTDDKAAVDDAISKIDAIGRVELDKGSKDRIDAARAAYDKLDKELQEYVTNYDTLTKAEKRYQWLSDAANSGSSSSGSKTDSKTDGKDDGKNVKSGNTADNSHLTLWLGGVVVSAAALALLAKKRRQDA